MSQLSGVAVFLLLFLCLEHKGNTTPNTHQTTSQIEDTRQLQSNRWLARRTKRKKRRKKSLPSSPININTATIKDFIRLPRIGKSKARRILELRRKLRRFSSVSQLTQVRGIGRRTLAKIRPYLTVGTGSQTPATSDDSSHAQQARRKRYPRIKRRRRSRRSRRRGRRRRNCYERWRGKYGEQHRLQINVNVAGARELRTLPCIGKKKASAIIAHRVAHGAFAVPMDLRKVSGIGRKTLGWLRPHVLFKLNLNRASLKELEALTPLAGGIGEAIYKYRRRHGMFRNLRQLLRVPGMGRSTLERIQPFVTIHTTRRSAPPITRTKPNVRTRPNAVVIPRSPHRRTKPYKPPPKRPRRLPPPKVIKIP